MNQILENFPAVSNITALTLENAPPEAVWGAGESPSLEFMATSIAYSMWW